MKKQRLKIMREKEILLVDDNHGDVFLTRRALNKAKIVNELVVAKDGVEALDYLFGNQAETSSEEKSCPALILLDLKLPKTDGLEVLKRIRDDHRTSACPVVILTASQEETNIFKEYKLGANSFVRKPVNSDQFVEAISWLGSYWLGLSGPPPVACVY
jgi:two-component system, response regulator